MELLSHSETLDVCGLTAGRLLTWYERRFLPADEFLPLPGRGNRRRYGLEAALMLAIVRVLADAGLPVGDSVCLARQLRAVASNGAGTLFAIIPRPPAWSPEAAPGVVATGSFVGVRTVATGPELRARLLDGPLTVPLGPGRESEPELCEVMRAGGTRHAVLVDVDAVQADFLERLARVLASRKARDGSAGPLVYGSQWLSR